MGYSLTLVPAEDLQVLTLICFFDPGLQHLLTITPASNNFLPPLSCTTLHQAHENDTPQGFGN